MFKTIRPGKKEINSSATQGERMADARKLDATIEDKLRELGYGL
jgi:hypothetical protein